MYFLQEIIWKIVDIFDEYGKTILIVICAIILILVIYLILSKKDTVNEQGKHQTIIEQSEQIEDLENNTADRIREHLKYTEEEIEEIDKALEQDMKDTDFEENSTVNKIIDPNNFIDPQQLNKNRQKNNGGGHIEK